MPNVALQVYNVRVASTAATATKRRPAYHDFPLLLLESCLGGCLLVGVQEELRIRTTLKMRLADTFRVLYNASAWAFGNGERIKALVYLLFFDFMFDEDVLEVLIRPMAHCSTIQLFNALADTSRDERLGRRCGLAEQALLLALFLMARATEQVFT